MIQRVRFRRHRTLDRGWHSKMKTTTCQYSPTMVACTSVPAITSWNPASCSSWMALTRVRTRCWKPSMAQRVRNKWPLDRQPHCLRHRVLALCVLKPERTRGATRALSFRALLGPLCSSRFQAGTLLLRFVGIAFFPSRPAISIHFLNKSYLIVQKLTGKSAVATTSDFVPAQVVGETKSSRALRECQP